MNLSNICISVFATRVDRGEITGVDVDKLTEVYLRARETNTLKTYQTEYKKLRLFCLERKLNIFHWTEWGTVSYLLFLSEKKSGEATVRNSLATISMLCEVSGNSSPTTSQVVSKIKTSVLKEANEGRKKRLKIPMRMKHLKIIIGKF